MSDKLKDIPVVLGAIGTWTLPEVSLANIVGLLTAFYTLLRTFEWIEKRIEKRRKAK